MFEVSQPDDPVHAVRGTEIVRDVVALQAENAQTAARQLVHCGTAHSTHTDDDCVILRPHEDRAPTWCSVSNGASQNYRRPVVAQAFRPANGRRGSPGAPARQPRWSGSLKGCATVIL